MKVMGAVVLILGIILMVLGNVILESSTGFIERYNAYFLRGLGIVLTGLGILLAITISVKHAIDEKRFSAVLLKYFGKGVIGFTIARIVGTALLVWALCEHPYGYYTLLRFVVCGTTSYGAYLAARHRKIGWAWIFGIVTVLFNPIFPIHLERSTWAIIDVIIAVLLTLSIFLFKEPKVVK